MRSKRVGRRSVKPLCNVQQQIYQHSRSALNISTLRSFDASTCYWMYRSQVDSSVAQNHWPRWFPDNSVQCRFGVGYSRQRTCRRGAARAARAAAAARARPARRARVRAAATAPARRAPRRPAPAPTPRTRPGRTCPRLQDTPRQQLDKDSSFMATSIHYSLINQFSKTEVT